MKIFVTLLLVLGIGVGAAWYFAGNAEPPKIEFVQPGKAVGQLGEMTMTVDAPQGRLTQLNVVLEQGETRTPLFSLSEGSSAQLTRAGDDRLQLKRPVGKHDIPSLQAGPARIVATAVRPVLFGLREVESTATRDFEVRLSPPVISVVSTHHYINHGGSEMVVYRVTPADVDSGVRVGNYTYQGFPASGAGVAGADPSLRVALFALLWDQDLSTPIQVFAKDEVGNESTASFDYRVFPKAFRKSRIPIDDRFLNKVVPAILQNSPELGGQNGGDLLSSFLRINNDLRRQNNATISALGEKTAPKMLWQGPFKQLLNTAVEAGFADQRTYVYNGRDVDQQVHLGFDLASTSAAPVHPANNGTVLHAGWLGIYGNCVIVDHGMGLQSLYAHLSSIETKVGDSVTPETSLGRSGSTGLAGGDHLHFTMLLGGHAITPIDWWSKQWIDDRIVRKLREADAPAAQAAPATP